MARPKNKPTSAPFSMARALDRRFVFDYLYKCLFDPNFVAPICYLLLLGEVLLNVLIIENVSYTEIDWSTYMQQVECFLNGTLEYEQIKGDTGPCVYPAGHLYVYSMLHTVTSHGTNLRIAQYIFLALFVGQSYLTYELYRRTCKVPGFALILSALTSYRIHSIYVLRMFNDPVAVLLFYASLHLFLSDRWKLGSVFYSLAVSVKMNILLYAPCLLLAYCTNLTLPQTTANLAICALVQLVLGAPFLYADWWSYLKAGFNLGRVFEHRWTVNYRFLDVGIFESPSFHVALLLFHVALLALFYGPVKRYFISFRTLRNTIIDLKSETKRPERPPPQKEVVDEKLTPEQQSFLDSFERQMKKGAAATGPKQRRKTKAQKQQDDDDAAAETYEINFGKISQLFVLPFFVTNLVGVACARSLHYQFYSWYFHSLLYLAYSTSYRKPLAFLLLACVEYCWNVYPSTDFSSALLHVCHGFLLVGVYRTMKV